MERVNVVEISGPSDEFGGNLAYGSASSKLEWDYTALNEKC
jgi:hypothetical protein